MSDTKERITVKQLAEANTDCVDFFGTTSNISAIRKFLLLKPEDQEEVIELIDEIAENTIVVTN